MLFKYFKAIEINDTNFQSLIDFSQNINTFTLKKKSILNERCSEYFELNYYRLIE
jgi:hypothetical protein